jgi:predicted GNAT superfamily acetyltransferase
MPYAADVATVATAVEIRDVRGPAELRECQALQRQVWGIIEDGYLLPVATMAAAQRVGGSVLGAFDADGRLLGFAFAFLGRLAERDILYSQLAAVRPDAQARGIGRQLKLEQRRRAQAMGLESVVWAFDPLQASNAFFNLGVLGATCAVYEVDLYGSRSDALNAGLATDRLLAEWPTQRKPAPLPDAWPAAPDLLETAERQPGLRAALSSRDAAALGTDYARLEGPSDLARIKREPSIALEWQRHVRRAFQLAFAAGFKAVGFSRGDQPGYLLRREQA